MSTAPCIPAPHSETDTSTRSDALRRCLQDLLDRIIGASDVVLVEVDCPLLLGGPVTSSRRDRPTTATPRLVVKSLVIPGTANLPHGTLLLAASDSSALEQACAWPVMISFLLDLELARLAAETAARGALEIANRDPATGLGNRRAWESTLRTEAVRAHRTGCPLTLLVLDIDGLKAVNDTRGHASGDALIARAAGALRSLRRATDEVCRLGGDEFGIAAPDTDELQARFVGARVRQSLKEVGVRVSLGFAVSSGDFDVNDLWQRADQAMYEDKRSRRPSWEAQRHEAELAAKSGASRMPRP